MVSPLATALDLIYRALLRPTRRQRERWLHFTSSTPYRDKFAPAADKAIEKAERYLASRRQYPVTELRDRWTS